MRAANFQGRFRSAPFTATITRGERGVPMLSVESLDAGATLRFVDIYKRMYGGKLALSTYMNDGPQSGIIQIRSFTLRNEPALSSIMAQGPSSSEVVDARGRKRVVQGQGSEVTFDRMRRELRAQRKPRRFHRAAISNAVMGFTSGGYLEPARSAQTSTARSFRSTA